MTIQKNLTTRNFTDKNDSSRIEYIVVHYTGNDGDTAYNNTKYFKTEYRGASAHYFVDETSIWQCVLDEDIAWHCGTTGTYYHKKCRNTNSIGIELCSRVKDGKYYIPEETLTRAAELIHYLRQLYNIPMSNILRHYDITHKQCPAPFVEDKSQWADFLSKVEYFGQQEEKPECFIDKYIETYGEEIVDKALRKLFAYEEFLNKQ
jgi:N-acetylmuramoyl-L-alanine amidase CwlA